MCVLMTRKAAVSRFLLETQIYSPTDEKSPVSDFSLLAGRMRVPELADRTLERRTDLAHPGPSQILHVSSAKRFPARHQIERDVVEVREQLRGLTIRARAGGAGREDPLQRHKAVERRADHDDAGRALHRRLVRFIFRVCRDDTRARRRLRESERSKITRNETRVSLANARHACKNFRGTDKNGKLLNLLAFAKSRYLVTLTAIFR